MRSSSTIALCALHLVGNALLLWLGYRWLSIPESDASHLLWSLCIVLLFACSALWLHGLAFVHFGRELGRTLRDSALIAVRHLPALFVLAIVAVLLYAALNALNGVLASPAFKLASWLTLTLRRPVPPARVLAVVHGMIWLLRWLVLPLALVPAAAALANNGFAGLTMSGSRLRLLRSVEIVLLILAAIWLPIKLLAWIPNMPNFSAEMASFLARGAVAYLLFVGCLLLIERRASSGMPALNQPNTVPVP